MSEEEQEILDEAREWLYRHIDPEDVGSHNIFWVNGSVVFRKFKKGLSHDNIIYVANNSSDVSKAWKSYTGDDMIRVQYTDSTFENIHEDEILKREWFKVSLKWMLVCNLIQEKMLSFDFATYHPIFSYHSKIDFDKLEYVTERSFEFERNFKKPKNKLYATIEI